MSVDFCISYNKRYVTVVENRWMAHYFEQRKIWEQEIVFNNFRVLGAGDNGSVVLLTDEGVIVYPKNVKGEIKRLSDFGREGLSKEGLTLGETRLDSSGNLICIETIREKERIADKFLGFMKKTDEKSNLLFELSFIDLQKSTRQVIHSYEVDRHIQNPFNWVISTKFIFMAVAQAQKVFRGPKTKFRLINLKANDSFDEFELAGNNDWLLFINANGNLLVDSPTVLEERNVIISEVTRKKHRVTARDTWSVVHIARNFVVFKDRFASTYIFKRFDNSVITEVSLVALDNLNLEYEVFFDHCDDIAMIVKKGNDIKIIHSNIDSFPVDARRWEVMIEQKKMDEEIAKKKKILETKKEKLAEKRSRIKAQDLRQSVMNLKNQRAQKKQAELDEKLDKLQKLKESLKTRVLSKYEYVQRKKEIIDEIATLQAEMGIEEQAADDLLKIIPPDEDRETREISLTEELEKYVPQLLETPERAQAQDLLRIVIDQKMEEGPEQEKVKTSSEDRRSTLSPDIEEQVRMAIERKKTELLKRKSLADEIKEKKKKLLEASRRDDRHLLKEEEQDSILSAEKTEDRQKPDVDMNELEKMRKQIEIEINRSVTEKLEKKKLDNKKDGV
ncbi:MAG: hypothetical protein ACLFQV_12330 [Vulcanimicrobiota bacterium]